jgi:hypothetical protein
MGHILRMVSSALADARSTSCRAADAMLAMLMEESTRLMSSAPADSRSAGTTPIIQSAPQ